LRSAGLLATRVNELIDQVRRAVRFEQATCLTCVGRHHPPPTAKSGGYRMGVIRVIFIFWDEHTGFGGANLVLWGSALSLWSAATIYALFLIWVAQSGRLLAMLLTGSWDGGSPMWPRVVDLLERVKQWTLRR
jgi:hypothetical protein